MSLILICLFLAIPIILGFLIKKRYEKRNILFILNCITLFYVIEGCSIIPIIEQLELTTLIPRKVAQTSAIFSYSIFIVMPLFFIFWVYSILNLDKVLKPVESVKIIKFKYSGVDEILDDGKESGVPPPPR